MNRKFKEIYEKPTESIHQDVDFDDEEVVNEEADNEEEEEEEVVKTKPKSITMLSDDEEMSNEKSINERKEKEQQLPAQQSELLVMKNGKLVKEKPKMNVIDMFKKIRETKKASQESKSVQAENTTTTNSILPRNKEVEEVDSSDSSDSSNSSDNSDLFDNSEKQNNSNLVDENSYEGDIQPTAEDYERYKQMMSEGSMGFES